MAARKTKAPDRLAVGRVHAKRPACSLRGDSRRPQFLPLSAWEDSREGHQRSDCERDNSAEELRALVRRSKEVNRSPGLRFLAAVRHSMDRGAAGEDGSMDRKTLRDWVHRFNAAGLKGLFGQRTEGPPVRGAAGPVCDDREVWVRIAKSTASCAGDPSTSSTSSPRGSASTNFTRFATAKVDRS